MHLYQKHSPSSLGELAGNPQAVEEVKKWALLFESGKPQKPLLVYGPPGIGKTALAYALAKEMGWEILEFNASDTRNKSEVERVMGAASGSAGLFSRHRLILIDEVDGLQGTADRGGASAIAEIAKNARQPLMLIANDGWDRKLAPLRQHCKFIEMKKVNKRTVESVIARIAREERLELGDGDAGRIADDSDGDLRSAIIDLQARIPGSQRDRDRLIFECVRQMFKAQSYADAAGSFNGTTLDHDTVKLWVEQNIALEYERPEEIARAYDFLSRADVFDGRISRRQAWKLLKYSTVLMLAGVSLSKRAKYHKFVKYEFPSFLRSMSTSSEKRAVRKSTLRKIMRKCHVSLACAQEYLPLIAAAEKKGHSLAQFFELDEDELAFAVRA
ncbi:MAG: replication factor C large subunit [Candidatus Micrarchaeia archaeon]